MNFLKRKRIKFLLIWIIGFCVGLTVYQLESAKYTAKLIDYFFEEKVEVDLDLMKVDEFYKKIESWDAIFLESIYKIDLPRILNVLEYKKSQLTETSFEIYFLANERGNSLHEYYFLLETDPDWNIKEVKEIDKNNLYY